MTDFRALCAELVSEIQALRRAVADEVGCSSPEPSVIARARAELDAQPESKTSRLRYCDVHGQQPENAWGCPECVREMRHQLARPAPQGATDEELLDLFGVVTPVRYVKVYKRELDFARAVLARWGRPAIEPVPVSERLPGPEDCDEEGMCWWWHEETGDVLPHWVFAPAEVVENQYLTWLPHWALPVPGVEGANA
jgi:hypothetical protein